MTKQTYLSGAMLLTTASFFFILSGYIVNVLLGRFLGPVDYGRYGIVMVLIGVVNIIQATGLTQAVSKFVAEESTRSDAILKSALKIQLSYIAISTFLFIVLSSVIANLLRDPALQKYIILAALTFPLYALYSLYSDFYNGMHNFLKQTIMIVLFSITKTGLVILLAFFWQLTGVLVGFILAPILALVYGFKLPKRQISVFPLKKILIYSLPVIGYAFFANLLQSVDLFVIKIMSNNLHDPGYYTAAQNISKIPFFALGAFTGIIFPSIAKSIGEKNTAYTKLLILQTTKYAVMILFPTVVLMSIQSKFLVSTIYTHTYIQASDVLSPLILGIGCFTLFNIFSFILIAIGKANYALVVSIVCLIMAIFLGSLFFNQWGISGVAFGTSIACFLAMIIQGKIVYSLYQLHIQFGFIIKIIVITIILGTFSKMVSLSLIPFLLIHMILAFFYICYLILLKELPVLVFATPINFLLKKSNKKKD